MSSFLLLATVFLAAAVVAVPLAKRIGLGSVLGYLIAGIIIGQVSGLLHFNPGTLHGFAEFGIVMLMFVIGLELEPKSLWEMRHRLIGLGGLQIAITTVLLAGAATLFGMTFAVAIGIGMALALSSTAIVLQTLSEKRLTQTDGGRSSLSVLLTQDVAVIPMLIVIPLLAGGSVERESAVADDAHGGGGAAGGEGVEIAQAFLDSLPPLVVAGIMAASIAFIILGGHFLIRPLFRYIANAGLLEISTAATLFLVVVTALIMSLVGLSPALGTFLAGVMLANSEFRHEMESNIAPFKGLLLGLFFIMVGADINFSLLYAEFFPILGMTLLLILIKAAVLLFLARLFGLRGRDQWLFTLGLAQSGEFAFILFNFMQQTGGIASDRAATLILVATMSMVLTPALFIGYEYLAKRIGDPPDRLPDEEISELGPIIVAGVGRFGNTVNRLVGVNGYKTVVLDTNIKAINMARRRGFKAYLGDPRRPELLEGAGLQHAEALVVAIDSSEGVLNIVQYARRRRPDLYIVSRARTREDFFKLYQAGASEIVLEVFDSSLRAGRYILQKMGISEEEARRRARTYTHYERRSARELAAVWDPEIPIDENETYLKRMVELDQEIKAGFGAQFEGIEFPSEPDYEDDALTDPEELEQEEKPAAAAPSSPPARSWERFAPARTAGRFAQAIRSRSALSMFPRRKS